MDYFGGYEIIQSPRVTESQHISPWEDPHRVKTHTASLGCKLHSQSLVLSTAVAALPSLTASNNATLLASERYLLKANNLRCLESLSKNTHLTTAVSTHHAHSPSSVYGSPTEHKIETNMLIPVPTVCDKSCAGDATIANDNNGDAASPASYVSASTGVIMFRSPSCCSFAQHPNHQYANVSQCYSASPTDVSTSFAATDLDGSLHCPRHMRRVSSSIPTAKCPDAQPPSDPFVIRSAKTYSSADLDSDASSPTQNVTSRFLKSALPQSVASRSITARNASNRNCAANSAYHDASYTRRILLAFHQWKYDVESTLRSYIQNVKNWTGLGGVEFVTQQFSPSKFKVFLLGHRYTLPRLAVAETDSILTQYTAANSLSDPSHVGIARSVESNANAFHDSQQRRRALSAEPTLSRPIQSQCRHVCRRMGFSNYPGKDNNLISSEDSEIRLVRDALANAIASLTFMSYRRDFQPMYRLPHADSFESESTSCGHLFSYQKAAPLPAPECIRITSDAGWGCTIRCAQMLLFEVLQRHFLWVSCNRVTLSFTEAHSSPPIVSQPSECLFYSTEQAKASHATDASLDNVVSSNTVVLNLNLKKHLSRTHTAVLFNRDPIVNGSTMASTPRRGSIVVLSALQYMPPIADNNFVNVAKMYNVYSSEQKFDPHTTASIHDTKNQRHPFVPYSLSNDNLHSLSSEDLHTSTDVPFPSITANSVRSDICTAAAWEKELQFFPPLPTRKEHLLELFLDLPSPPTKHPFSVYSFVRSAGGGLGWASSLYGNSPVETRLIASLRLARPVLPPKLAYKHDVLAQGRRFSRKECMRRAFSAEMVADASNCFPQIESFRNRRLKRANYCCTVAKARVPSCTRCSHISGTPCSMKRKHTDRFRRCARLYCPYAMWYVKKKQRQRSHWSSVTPGGCSYRRRKPPDNGKGKKFCWTPAHSSQLSKTTARSYDLDLINGDSFAECTFENHCFRVLDDDDYEIEKPAVDYFRSHFLNEQQWTVMGKRPGDWFGLATISYSIKYLVESCHLTKDSLAVYVSTDGVLDTTEILQLMNNKSQCETKNDVFNLKHEKTRNTSACASTGATYQSSGTLDGWNVLHDTLPRGRCQSFAHKRQRLIAVRSSATSDNNCTYNSKVDNDFQTEQPKEKGILLCFPLTLGKSHVLSPLHYPSLTDYFEFPWFVGAIGSKAGKKQAFYFVGKHERSAPISPSRRPTPNDRTHHTESTTGRTQNDESPLYGKKRSRDKENISFTHRTHCSTQRTAVSVPTVSVLPECGDKENRDTHCHYRAVSQSASITTRRPRHTSLWVETDLLYLDPHIVQDSATSVQTDWDTFHHAKLFRAPLSLVDPGVLLAFYCPNRSSLFNFFRCLASIAEKDRYAPLRIVNKCTHFHSSPCYSSSENKKRSSALYYSRCWSDQAVASKSLHAERWPSFSSSSSFEPPIQRRRPRQHVARCAKPVCSASQHRRSSSRVLFKCCGRNVLTVRPQGPVLRLFKYPYVRTKMAMRFAAQRRALRFPRAFHCHQVIRCTHLPHLGRRYVLKQCCRKKYQRFAGNILDQRYCYSHARLMRRRRWTKNVKERSSVSGNFSSLPAFRYTLRCKKRRIFCPLCKLHDRQHDTLELKQCSNIYQLEGVNMNAGRREHRHRQFKTNPPHYRLCKNPKCRVVFSNKRYHRCSFFLRSRRERHNSDGFVEISEHETFSPPSSDFRDTLPVRRTGQCKKLKKRCKSRGLRFESMPHRTTPSPFITPRRLTRGVPLNKSSRFPSVTLPQIKVDTDPVFGTVHPPITLPYIRQCSSSFIASSPALSPSGLTVVSDYSDQSFRLLPSPVLQPATSISSGISFPLGPRKLSPSVCNFLFC